MIETAIICGSLITIAALVCGTVIFLKKPRQFTQASDIQKVYDTLRAIEAKLNKNLLGGAIR